MYEVPLTTLVTIKRQMTLRQVWLTPPVTSGRQMTLRQVYLSRGYPSPAGHRGSQLHLLVSQPVDSLAVAVDSPCDQRATDDSSAGAPVKGSSVARWSQGESTKEEINFRIFAK